MSSPMRERICVRCGDGFQHNRYRSYCSVCRDISIPRICPACEQPFMPPRAESIHCSTRCAMRSNGAAGGRGHKIAGRERNCATCGVEFRWRSHPKQPNGPLTCSRDCGRFVSNGWILGESTEVPWQECHDCGRRCIDRRPGRKQPRCPTCIQVKKTLEAVRKKQRGRCKECDKPVTPWEYQPGRVTRAYCGVKCLQSARRDAKHRMRVAVRAGLRTHVPQIKALSPNPLSLYNIAERDGWVCSICGEDVPKKFGNYGRAPSLDHIIPISRGGLHIAENLALAHKACNSSKGNRPR